MLKGVNCMSIDIRMFFIARYFDEQIIHYNYDHLMCLYFDGFYVLANLLRHNYYNL